MRQPYKKDDIVICIKKTTTTKFIVGDKYKVLNIEFDRSRNTFLVDVQHIESGEIEFGWNSTIFIPEIDYEIKKYNI